MTTQDVRKIVLLVIDEEEPLMVVELFKEEYPIIDMSDFDYERKKTLFQAAETSANYFKATDNRQKALTLAKLDNFIKQILPTLPEEVFKRLKEAHKHDILSAFSEAVAANGEFQKAKAAYAGESHETTGAGAGRPAPLSKEASRTVKSLGGLNHQQQQQTDS